MISEVLTSDCKFSRFLNLFLEEGTQLISDDLWSPRVQHLYSVPSLSVPDAGCRKSPSACRKLRNTSLISVFSRNDINSLKRKELSPAWLDTFPEKIYKSSRYSRRRNREGNEMQRQACPVGYWFAPQACLQIPHYLSFSFSCLTSFGQGPTILMLDRSGNGSILAFFLLLK